MLAAVFPSAAEVSEAPDIGTVRQASVSADSVAASGTDTVADAGGLPLSGPPVQSPDSTAAPQESPAGNGSLSPSAIEDDILYDAQDSIVLIGSTTAILYGDAHVKYQNMDLRADYIRLRLDSNTVYATGSIDSTGAMVGIPVFSEGSQSFESKAMRYNFETKKGFIYGTVTEQGEGYVTSDKTKKTDEDIYCLQGGKYTTCDNHDHPHFYLALTKAKMKQGKYIVSGPAYMVVEDIPVPLALPFGYFPMTKSYQSGIILPTFGEESSRGFYAEGFGYYFAINDYIDMALTADVYTKGSSSGMSMVLPILRITGLLPISGCCGRTRRIPR